MRNFRKFKIWQESIEIVKAVYELSLSLPVEVKYGLKSQICRATISIPPNTAEGCSRNSNMEFKRFLEIAIGSVFELETQLQIIRELSLTTPETVEPIINDLHIV